MKKEVIKIIEVITGLFIVLLILDYVNLPTLLGFKMSNINIDFFVGIINAIIVIVLFCITYKEIDKRTVQREKNKRDISKLLIKKYYEDCLDYIEMLSQETIEKYVVPKINFNSSDNVIICNLQNSPFLNGATIWDFVKDGQVEEKRIEQFLNIKKKYEQYISSRIIFYDAQHIYAPLRSDLCITIKCELKYYNN